MADTLIKRVGGKVKIKEWIINNLPPHTIYVEAFAGSFAVGLGLPKPDGTKYRVVLNDLDCHVYNLFRVLRDHAEEFHKKVVLTPYSRHDFDEACRIIKYERDKKQWEQIDRVEWARLYLAYNRQSMFGKEDGTWCVSRHGENICLTWAGLPPLVASVAEHLKQCYIECDDYRNVTARWDSPQTVHYLDPPYENVEKSFYAVNKEEGFDHKAMADAVKALKGSVAISYYDSPEIRSLYPESEGFTYHFNSVLKHMQKSDKKDKATEILVVRSSQWAAEQHASKDMFQ